MDDNEHADDTPICYKTGLGFWVHGPGCRCGQALVVHADVATVGAEAPELT